MGIGKELKRLRDEVPISVDKIADKIGVKAARWRKWEELDQKPRKEDTEIIEEFFNMTLVELIEQKSIKKFLKVPNVDGADFNKKIPLGDFAPTMRDYFEQISGERDRLARLLENGFGELIQRINGNRENNEFLASAIDKRFDELKDQISSLPVGGGEEGKNEGKQTDLPSGPDIQPANGN